MRAMDEEKAIMESMIAKLADEKDELAAKVRESSFAMQVLTVGSYVIFLAAAGGRGGRGDGRSDGFTHGAGEAAGGDPAALAGKAGPRQQSRW